MTKLENSTESDAVQRVSDLIAQPTGTTAMYRFADMMDAVRVLGDLSEQIGRWTQDGHTFGEMKTLYGARLVLIDHIRDLGASL